MSDQAGWRWCCRCDGLFFSGSGTSACPLGGNHDSTGSSYYFAILDPVHDAQAGWRWCRKCQGMFYSLISAGRCPTGGGHDAAGSAQYMVAVERLKGSITQSNWRWCSKCQGLFFAGRSMGRCPAGGTHTNAGSGNYVVAHGSVRPPSSARVHELITKYAPIIYFHSEERYKVATPEWFLARSKLFDNGTEIATTPATIQSLLPTGPGIKDRVYLALPENDAARAGDVASAKALVRAKYMDDPIYLDLQFWLFYAYNGPGTAKAWPLEEKVSLAPLGEHEGDWEHVTMRINHSTGELVSVYLSQHDSGVWIENPRDDLEWQNGRPVVYSSLNGHGSYNGDGANLSHRKRLDLLVGDGYDFGLRNDADRGSSFDCLNYQLISTNFLPASQCPEPSWLAYTGRWGRIKSYIIPSFTGYAVGGKNILDEVLADAGLGEASDMFGQSGPTGPREKGAWTPQWTEEAEGVSPPWLSGNGIVVLHQGYHNCGEIWRLYRDGQRWSHDRQIPGGMSASPSAVMYQYKLSVFYEGQGDSGTLWHTFWDENSWSNTTQVPNVGISGAPSAVVFRDKLYVFHQGLGDNGQLWYTVWNGSAWEADRQVPNTGMSDGPSAVVFNNKLYVFHQGYHNCGELWYNVFDGTSWSGDKRVLNAGMSAGPSAVVHNNKLHVFHEGAGDDGRLLYVVFDGNTWTNDILVPNVGITETPSAVVDEHGKLLVFHQGIGDCGELWYVAWNGSSWEPDQHLGHVGMSAGPSAVLYKR